MARHEFVYVWPLVLWLLLANMKKSPGFMSVRPKVILYVRIRSCRRRLTTKLPRLSLHDYVGIAKIAAARKTLCKFELDTFNFAHISNEIGS